MNYYNLKKQEQKLMKHDSDKIKKLREELKNYDLVDFLCNISALMLIPENQSKSVIFQCMISTALSINKNEFNSNNKMSIGKFKTIVSAFSNLDRKEIIDPPEFPFVLPIIYYGNYHVFMGANSLSPIYVNAILKVFSAYKDKIDSKVYFELNKTIKGLLKISEYIWKRLNLNFEELKSYNKDIDIVIPSSNTLNKYKEIVNYSNDEIYNLFGEFIDELNCHFGDVKMEDIMNFDYQLFYSRPFLMNQECTIILDVTTFISLIMDKILSFTSQDSSFNLCEEYNKYLRFSLIKSFNRLGNCKIDASYFNIELINNKNVGEILYSNGNDGIIINILLFDTGEKYKEIKNYKNKVNRYYIYNRISYITEMLVKNNIKKEKIIVIVTPSTIGRNMFYSLDKCNMNNILILTQYEIDAISINEEDETLFFHRYITARKKLVHYEKNLFSELNFIALYVQENYSFYFNDTIDIKDAYLSIIGEYSADYIQKAYIKEDFHLTKFISNNSLIEVIKLNTNIYFAPGLFFDKQLNKVLECNNFTLWVMTEKNSNPNQYDLYNQIIDIIIFWFSQLIDDISYRNITCSIVIELEKNIMNCSTETLFINNIDELIDYSFDNNQLKLFIKKGILSYFNCENNEKEKEFIKYIINILSNKIEQFYILTDTIDMVFKNPYKKKIISIDSIKQPYMIPFSSNKTLKISRSDENLILDKIGLYLSKEKKISYGIISDKKILNHVVEMLYNQLLENLKQYEKKELLTFLYLEYEKTISSIHIRERYYDNDLSCYPNHKNEIDLKITELHKASVALRFLIELASSLINTGNLLISQYDIEYDLAIASQIIEWAYANDLFYYGMIKSPIELLKSNRIGFNHDIISRFGQSMYSALSLKRNVSGKENMKKFSKYLDNDSDEEIGDFENAFCSEFQYEFKDYTELTVTLLEYAEQKSNSLDQIFTLKISTLIDNLKEKINKDNILKIIDVLSLKERKDYLNPPKPFRTEDTYPWRNNRSLALSRKPLIIYGDEIIYGYRTLANSVYFLLDLISSGKFCAHSEEMKEYISKISNYNGEVFNKQVYKYISSFSNLIVDMKVKKVNGKKIVDYKKNDLGDIDILFISKRRGIIMVCETKDFGLAKNFYEIHNEYIKMFDFDNPKSFYNKHLRRVDWIKKHINDLIVQYNLPNKKWKVEYLFIVDDYLISKEIFDVKVNLTTLYNLESILKKY